MDLDPALGKHASLQVAGVGYNNTSLQPKTDVIMRTLSHISLRERQMHIDSRAAVDSLQPNATYLLTTVYTIMQKILVQGRNIIIIWVPSHIGIQRNELPDRLAGKGRVIPSNPTIINPKPKNLKVQVQHQSNCHSSAATQKKNRIFPRPDGTQTMSHRQFLKQ